MTGKDILIDEFFNKLTNGIVRLMVPELPGDPRRPFLRFTCCDYHVYYSDDFVIPYLESFVKAHKCPPNSPVT